MLRLKNFQKQRRKVRVSTLAPAGAPPGSFTVDSEAPPTRITAYLYGPEKYEVIEDVDLDQIEGLLGKMPVVWFDVVGLGDAAVLNRLGAIFQLHPLLLEDVVNVHQRPKFEQFEDETFMISRMNRGTERLYTEQVSIVRGRRFVLTFQEQEGDCLGPIRQRITNNAGRMRREDTAYLAYAIIDAIVDHYFPLLELYDQRLDELELSILEERGPQALADIHDLRRQLVAFRRYVWPLQSTINSFILKGEGEGEVREELVPFWRDCEDHLNRALELIDQQAQIANGLLDLYLSIESRRMNEIVKVLTILATIFMPMTFVAGIYGMNFDPGVSKWNMPELSWAYGYPFAMGLMLAIGIGMVIFFVRKGWLGGGK